MTSLRDSTTRPSCGWNLAARPGRNFRNPPDDKSVASVLNRIRGGSDPYYGDYGRRKGSSYGYNDGYSQQQDYYGQDDDSEDDEGDGDYNYPNDRRSSRRSSSRRYDYDDYGDSTRPAPDASSIFQALPSIIQKGDRRIGSMLLGSGALVTMLGVSLFFNKALMRLGNLLFIAGVPMILGPSRTMGYFLKPEKFRATACLTCGIFLVLVGSPVFGIALEIFGLLNLFGNMFPVVLAIAKNMPVIGPILSGNNNNNNNSGYSRGRGRNRYSEDPYYDERGYDDDYYGDDYSQRDDYRGSNDYY